MNHQALSLPSAIPIGLGATLVFDLWGLFLKQAFQIPSCNICLVRPWLRTMPKGTFKHSNIAFSVQLHNWYHVRRHLRCLSRRQVAATSDADSRSRLRAHHGPDPILHLAAFIGSRICCIQARLRSLMNHTAFGVSLYMFALFSNG
jgi:hypothetical protein